MFVCTLTLLKLALCSHSDLARSKALWSFLKSSMVIFFNQQESLWIFPHSTLINSIWYDQTWSNLNFQPIRIKTIRHRALTALDLKCCMGGKLQSIIQFKICLLSFYIRTDRVEWINHSAESQSGYKDHLSPVILKWMQ